MSPRELNSITEWPADDIVFCMAASDALDRVWLGSSDAGVYELDFSTDKPPADKPPADRPLRTRLGGGHTSYVTGLALCRDRLISCSYDRQLIWWNVGSGKQEAAVAAHDRWIRRVVATPDGNRVVSVADDMRCRVWDVRSQQLIADFSDHSEVTPHHYPSMLYALAVSADGSQIATGDRAGHVAIWDAERFEKLAELEAPVMYTWDSVKRRHSIGGIRSLAFSPDGSKLAVGGMGKVGNIDHLKGPSRLEIFDLGSEQRLHELEDNKHQGLIEQLVWSPDATQILAAGGAHKGFVVAYDTESGEQTEATGFGGHVHALCHDEAIETLFLGGHQRLGHWSWLPQT